MVPNIVPNIAPNIVPNIVPNTAPNIVPNIAPNNAPNRARILSRILLPAEPNFAPNITPKKKSVKQLDILLIQCNETRPFQNPCQDSAPQVMFFDMCLEAAGRGENSGFLGKGKEAGGKRRQTAAVSIDRAVIDTIERAELHMAGIEGRWNSVRRTKARRTL